MLLDVLWLVSKLHRVAYVLDAGPGALNVHRVVERELLVHIPYVVIRPHVVKAVLDELAVAVIWVDIAHKAVAKEYGAGIDVLLEDRG